MQKIEFVDLYKTITLTLPKMNFYTKRKFKLVKKKKKKINITLTQEPSILSLIESIIKRSRNDNDQ